MKLKKLIKLINTKKNKHLSNKVYNWLKNNTSNKHFKVVAKSLIKNCRDKQIYIKLLKIFRENISIACKLLPYLIKYKPKLKTKLINFAIKLIRLNNNSESSIFLAVILINDFEVVELSNMVYEWISVRENSKISPVLIVQIIHSKIEPIEFFIKIAINWFNENKHDWYSVIVLACLLNNYPNQSFVNEALEIFKQRNISNETILLIKALVMFDESNANFIHKWIETNSDHPRVLDICFEGFSIKPELFISNIMELSKIEKTDLLLLKIACNWLKKMGYEKNYEELNKYLL